MQALWEWDQAVFRAIHLDGHRTWLDPIFWVISTTGLGYVQGIAILLASMHWGAWPKLRLQPYFWPALLSMALPGLLNLPFKEFLPRERPSNYVWANPQEGFYYDSFASGHSATSFGLAFYLWFRLWGTAHQAWGGVALVWACGVGYSRVYRGVHWVTDVIAALFEGLLVAAFIRWWETSRSTQSDPSPETSGSDAREVLPDRAR